MKIYRLSQQERVERASREAAEWLRVMQDVHNADDRAGFMDWVRASPLHLRELLVLQVLEREVDASKAMAEFDVDRVVAAARDENNVVAIREAMSARRSMARTVSTQARTRRRVRRRVRIAVLAAVLLVGASLGWMLLAPPNPAQSYATALGEQQRITLADGTRVTLAASSRIGVEFSARRREVILYSGKADFDVVHDAARPFSVHAGASVIHDVGTEFSVNRLPSGTVVTVVEGEVAVTRDHASALNDGLGAWFKSWLPADVDLIRQQGATVMPLAGARKISAGQTAHITGNGRDLTLAGADLRATRKAGDTKQLVFHNSTLADIAAEFNRYNSRKIVVQGALARKQRFGGIMDADDAASFVQFLSCCSRLEVGRSGVHTVIRFPPSTVAIQH